MSEVERSAQRAKEHGKRLEAEKACTPLIDPLRAMRASLSGGSTTTARIYGAKATPPLTRPERLVAAVEDALRNHQAANRPQSDELTPQQRRQAAAAYREQAARIEAGA